MLHFFGAKLVRNKEEIMALHVMDEANHCLGCKNPRCQQGCPIHTNIPEVIRLLKDNKLNEAGRMLFENNPLTTVCSLICNHENQCEGHCVRGIKGAPVHFSVIENYISSAYASQMTHGPAEPNGKRVAIIGSGPAGLTIAQVGAGRFRVPPSAPQGHQGASQHRCGQGP